MSTTTTTPGNATDAAVDLSDLVAAGTAALNDGDLRLALDKFEAVVAAFPDRPEGHNNLGALYSSIGDFAKAEQCFDLVLALLPDNANVHYNRGVVRSRLEKFDAAREDFSAVLAANPNDPDTLNNLGVANYMQGHLDTARGFFSRALTAKPDYANALLNQVDLECTAGNFSRGVQLCEEFLTGHNDIDVRRKHLDLLSSGCREALAKASRVAESILVVEQQNETVRAELGRITQAQAVWADTEAGRI